jgi:hypothetical protein
MMRPGRLSVRRSNVGGGCVGRNTERVVVSADQLADSLATLPPLRQYTPASRSKKPSSIR